MATVDASHPFFGKDNLTTLKDLIDQTIQRETGEAFDMKLNDKFVEAMMAASVDFGHWIKAPNQDQGVYELNKIMVKRAVRQFTKPDEAGQYTSNNFLYGPTRRGKKMAGVRPGDQDDWTDPESSHARIWMNNPHAKRWTEKWREQDRQTQNARDVHQDLWDALDPSNYWTEDQKMRSLY